MMEPHQNYRPPIEVRDGQGKVVASSRRRHSPQTVEQLTEQGIQEGRIRYADDPAASVRLLAEHLERSASVEGVLIDADDCAAIAANIRALLARTGSENPHG